MNKNHVNLFDFVGVMSTAVLIIASKMIFGQNSIVSFLLQILTILLILFFIFKFIQFVINLFDKKFLENNWDVSKINLFSAIAISSALISILFNIVPLDKIWDMNLYLSLCFWSIGLILWIIFILLIPVNLKFKSKIENVNWSWFIPPVGLFVIIMAWSILALNFEYINQYMAIINLMLFGPAFMIYLLTLSLIYYRSKFVELWNSWIIPSFHIVLAPVAVSILAILNTSSMITKYGFLWIESIFQKISYIYSLIFIWYGLWIFVSLIILYYKTIKQHRKIPFSDLRWAFVFPTWAFNISLLTIKDNIISNMFLDIFIYIVYLVLLIMWIYMIYKKILKKNVK